MAILPSAGSFLKDGSPRSGESLPYAPPGASAFSVFGGKGQSPAAAPVVCTDGNEYFYIFANTKIICPVEIIVTALGTAACQGPILLSAGAVLEAKSLRSAASLSYAPLGAPNKFSWSLHKHAPETPEKPLERFFCCRWHKGRVSGESLL